MASPGRLLARQHLGSILTTGLTGGSNPVQSVYRYLKKDFEGESPVVVVTSAGSEREGQGFQNCFNLSAYFNIYIFVLYEDEGSSWDEEDAENTVDTIEVMITDILSENRSTDYWNGVDFRQSSEPDLVDIGGTVYRREILFPRFRKVE